MLPSTVGLILPSTVGVDALLEVLSGLPEVSVGRICGGRVAAVWFGDSLEVVSVTLEPFELSDAALCRSRALAFVAEIGVV
jgi:hypothetical protein